MLKLYNHSEYVLSKFSKLQIYDMLLNNIIYLLEKKYVATNVSDDCIYISPQKSFSLYVNSFYPNICISNIGNSNLKIDCSLCKSTSVVLMIFTMGLSLLQLILLAVNIANNYYNTFELLGPICLLLVGHIFSSFGFKYYSKKIMKSLKDLLKAN